MSQPVQAEKPPDCPPFGAGKVSLGAWAAVAVDASERPQWVESGCGAVALGRPCRLPPLSSGGALVGRP
jgi:hypothetical protein